MLGGSPMMFSLATRIGDQHVLDASSYGVLTMWLYMVTTQG